MTEEEINNAFAYAKYSQELSGLTFTSEDERVIKAVFFGEISMDELIEDLKE